MSTDSRDVRTRLQALVVRWIESEERIAAMDHDAPAAVTLRNVITEVEDALREATDPSEDSERLDWLADFGIELCDDVTEPDLIFLRYLTAESFVRKVKAPTLRSAIDAARLATREPS